MSAHFSFSFTNPSLPGASISRLIASLSGFFRYDTFGVPVGSFVVVSAGFSRCAGIGRAVPSGFGSTGGGTGAGVVGGGATGTVGVVCGWGRVSGRVTSGSRRGVRGASPVVPLVDPPGDAGRGVGVTELR